MKATKQIKHTALEKALDYVSEDPERYIAKIVDLLVFFTSETNQKRGCRRNLVPNHHDLDGAGRESVSIPIVGKNLTKHVQS